jgi:nucleotide-binding universal stress UspA family protein
MQGQQNVERGGVTNMSIFPTRIVLATDGSKEAELATRTATDLAQKTGSELHVVHVFGIAPVGPPVYPEATDLQGEALEAEAEERISEQRAREVLEAEVGKVRSAGGTVVEAHLLEGRAAPEIVALAEEIGAGLIVVGSRGHGGIRRALMGSVSDSVVRHAHCPVLVARAAPIVFPAKILLATDGSEEAQLASSSVADLAKRTGSDLHLVYVGHMPPVYYESPGALTLDPDLKGRMGERAEEGARTILDEQVQRLREAGSEVAGAHSRLGRPDAEIVGLAEELGAGLIALGSRGLGLLSRALMGSVSHSVVRHAHCPVLVVRK